MKKYDVYGIGNALVDIEVQVLPEVFHKNNIEKGVMTLIEEDRHHHLLHLFHGEHKKMQGGGSAANTVVGVSQFGGNSFYSCKVAKDGPGEFYLNDLKKSGVDTVYSADKLPLGHTGKCIVMVTPDADRTMNTFLGITSTLSVDEVKEEAIKNSKYVYIEGYLVASPTGKLAAIKTRELAEKYGVKTSLTFSDPNMVKFFKDGLMEMIGNKVDLLFCNEHEAKDFVGTGDLKIAREELKKVARTFVITLGENGATIFDGDTFIDIEPYKVKAVDSNGAGDMYAGAFLYGITHGHSYASAGKLASLASSKVVSQFGPRLEWHQTKEILNELSGNI